MSLIKCISLLFVLTVCLFAGVNDVRLITDNVPDLSNWQTFTKSVEGHFTTPEQKSVAAWKWVLSLRQQSPQASENGASVDDPIRNFTCYGAHICSGAASTLTALWKDMGFSQYERTSFGGHTVAQAEWDGTFHMFDAAFGFYFRNKSTGRIVSIEEIKADPTMQTIASPVTTYSNINGSSMYEPDRTNEGLMREFLPDIRYNTWLNPSTFEYKINLRPCESYNRTWLELGKTNDFYTDYGAGDPNLTYMHPYIRSNGEWIFDPDFTTETYSETILKDSNMTVGETPKLHLQSPGRGWVVFNMDAANVITSASLKITGFRQTTEDTIRLSVSTDAGTSFTPVWAQTTIGADSIELSITSFVKINYGYQVKVELTTPSSTVAAGLNRLQISTITQIGQRSLPRLTLGTNRVMLKLGEQPLGASFHPMEVTYVWTEFIDKGTVERSHIEQISESSSPHEYYINVSGWRDPAMKQVILNFKGYHPFGNISAYGYSDGKDVGFQFERPRYYYTYGAKDLAYKKKYAVTPASKNDNLLKKLTDGVTTSIQDLSAIYIGARWNGSVNPSIVINLDTAKTIGGVRVLEIADSATCDFADSILISTSMDSNVFAQQGTIRKVDMWFAPTNIPLPSKWDSQDFRNYKNWGIRSFRFDYAFDNPIQARFVRFDVQNSKEVSIQEIEVQDSTMTKTLVMEELNNGFTLPPVAIEHGNSNNNRPAPALAHLEAWPNPFTASTRITYYPRENSKDRFFLIYDLSGRCVYRATLAKHGNEDIVWNGTNDLGKPLCSGVYIIQYKQKGKMLTHRLLLVR